MLDMSKYAFGLIDGFWGDPELNCLAGDLANLRVERERFHAGTVSEELYTNAANEFKQKWFGNDRITRLIPYINKTFDIARDECMAMIGVPKNFVDRYGNYVDKSTAARILGVSRPTVYVMIGDGRLQTDASGRLVSVQSITDYMTWR